jgi:hypothetical protein
MTGSDDEPYFRAIEEEFVRRRGAAMLLSPRDWALMGEWHRGGIPLPVVLQAIDNVFDAFERRSPTGRRVNSLSYCRQEVLALFDLYLSLRGPAAGRPTPASRQQGPDPARVVTRHLGRLHRALRRAMAVASEERWDGLVAELARAAAELQRLRKDGKEGRLDPAGLEDRLGALDAAVVGAALDCLPAAEVEEAEEKAGAQLLGRKTKMPASGLAATRRVLMAQWVRRRCRLVRLSLFD